MNRFAALLSVVLVAATGLGFAGSIGLAWDPVQESDLAGYRVYWGTAPNSYPNSRDAGNTTTTTLTGLDPCTRYYTAVKAYDTGGLQSASFSNEVSGLPRPVVSSTTPAAGEQGAQLTLTIAGESFDSGPTVEFSGTGITVRAVRRDACGQISVDITIDAAAVTGARDVTVVNPDRSFGTRAAAFTVNANPAPTVSSTVPVAGAANIAVGVKPTVTFSEPMSASSITASAVRLLDAAGAAVPQAAGSPAVSADGRTAIITPAAALKGSTTYRINVVGGSSGAKDANGKPLSADWTQTPGFTTGAADTQAPTVSRTNPADGVMNVAVGVKPTVTFSEPMSASSITSATVRLLDPAGNPVAQAAGSPVLSADRTVATITPAASLAERTTYKIQVVGGSAGAKDDAGNALASTWTQTAGFATQNLPPGAVIKNRRTDVR